MIKESINKFMFLAMHGIIRVVAFWELAIVFKFSELRVNVHQMINQRLGILLSPDRTCYRTQK